ncbi:hypothetical protein [Fibrobacter sp.]|uniref:hypothetical protein n=1 Tax=Fibrobacter sp. TaxID=35828 RepID=UPI003867504B
MKSRLLVFVLIALCTAFAEEEAVPKKELFSRARDALKTSLETGDKERAGQALGYLRTNVSQGAPLTRFEEYLVNMELGDYESAIPIYVDLRRRKLDPEYRREEETRVQVDDALAKYLQRDLIPLTKDKADSMYALVDKSDVPVESKKLYLNLLYTEMMFKDYDVGMAFINAAKDYMMYHPTSLYSEFLAKHKTISAVENLWRRESEFRNDSLKHKYYTGGVGAHVYAWHGFLGGDASKLWDDEMGDAFMFDLTMRVWRISVNAFWSTGLMIKPKDVYSSGKTEDESYGLTFGFTAFDSRYLRIEPFVGVGYTVYKYAGFSTESFDNVFGGNVDFRFYASRPSHIGEMTYAIDLRFKYMVQMGEFDGAFETGNSIVVADGGISANRHVFGIGLGVELW